MVDGGGVVVGGVIGDVYEVVLCGCVVEGSNFDFCCCRVGV